MMKALVRNRFGGPDVVHVEEVERPALEDDRVLVRVRASSINKADLHTLQGSPRPVRPISGNGVLRPKDPLFGTDFAGIVEAVGENVTDLAPGDEVFGGRSGAYAEYVVPKCAVKKPANVTFEEAGTIGIAGLTALQGLRDKGGLQPRRARPDQRRVRRGRNVRDPDRESARRKRDSRRAARATSSRRAQLGADHVIDRTQENFTRGSERYDLILDVAGGHSWHALRRALSPSGRVVLVGGHAHRAMLTHLAGLWLASRLGKHKLTFFVAKFNDPDLQTLADMMERGQLKPAIDRDVSR